MPGLFSMFNNGAMPPVIRPGGPGLTEMPMGPPTMAGPMGGGLSPAPMGPPPVLKDIGNLGMPGGPAAPAMGPAGDTMMKKLAMQGMQQRIGGMGANLLQAGGRPGGLMQMMGQFGGMAGGFRQGGMPGGAPGGASPGLLGSLFARR